ncbi:MAG: SRPBCC family protein [Ekhidna sp.]
MDKYAVLLNADTLKIERLLPGPIERVWEYLVDGEKRAKWFSGGKMDQTVGGTMQLIFDHRQLSPIEDPTPEKYKEHANGSESFATVLEIDPPRFLKINWEDGIVSFVLTEEGDQVRLVLRHERLKSDKDYKIGVLAGWHGHLDILVAVMNNRVPDGFWKAHMSLEEEYEKRFF